MSVLDYESRPPDVRGPQPPRGPRGAWATLALVSAAAFVPAWLLGRWFDVSINPDAWQQFGFVLWFKTTAAALLAAGVAHWRRPAPRGSSHRIDVCFVLLMLNAMLLPCMVIASRG